MLLQIASFCINRLIFITDNYLRHIFIKFAFYIVCFFNLKVDNCFCFVCKSFYGHRRQIACENNHWGRLNNVCSLRNKPYAEIDIDRPHYNQKLLVKTCKFYDNKNRILTLIVYFSKKSWRKLFIKAYIDVIKMEPSCFFTVYKKRSYNSVVFTFLITCMNKISQKIKFQCIF